MYLFKYNVPGNLYLFILIGVMLLSKSFAYLKAPGTPIYIIDFVMLAIVFLYLQRSNGFLLPKLLRPVLIIVLFSSIHLIISLLKDGINIDSVRDYMAFFYPIFSLVCYNILSYNNKRLLGVGLAFFIIIFHVFFIFTGFNLPVPWFDSLYYIKRGDLAVILSICFLSIMAFGKNKVFKVLSAFLAMFLFIDIYSVNRAGTLSFIIATTLYYYFKKGPIIILVLIPLLLLMIILIGTFINLGGGGVATVAWRILLWKTAIIETFNHGFLLGIGFGEALTSVIGFYDANLNRNPHNYFITVFFRLGLVGLAVYSFLLINVFWAAKNAIYNHTISNYNSKYRDGLIILLSVFMGALFNSCFDVYLENPYGAIIFWTILGSLVYWINISKRKVGFNQYALAK